MSGAEKNIMVLTDCSHGAMEAGRFAVKYLFDSNSRIILLQTYNTPEQGKTVLNNISPMLEKVARREMNELKARLSRECDIDPERIEIRVIEGDLKEIVVNEFGKIDNLSIVAGAISESLPNKIPCRNIISSLMDCNIHPVFLISECITLVEESRILLIAGNENKIPGQYLDYLRESARIKGKSFELITENNHKQFALAPESFSHFSMAMAKNKEKLEPIERLFYERVLTISPLSGNNE